MFWIFETLTSQRCHCTKRLSSVAVAWWAGRVAWCNSSYQHLFLFSFRFFGSFFFFFFFCFSHLKKCWWIIWTGNFKSTPSLPPVELDPFLLSYWIAVSVTRLEMGIYSDSMTRKGKKNTKTKTKTKKKYKQKERNFRKKKMQKKKCGEGWENIYRWVIWVCTRWLWR